MAAGPDLEVEGTVNSVLLGSEYGCQMLRHFQPWEKGRNWVQNWNEMKMEKKQKKKRKKMMMGGVLFKLFL